jgi:NhaA family Na+:H+ antiporter
MTRPTHKPQPVATLILRPFQTFAEREASGGIMLFVFTVLALAWANSPWAQAYTQLWDTQVTVGFGEAVLSKPLLLWINDGLMAVFFFVVGLEIKRELLVGELSSPRQALLPMVAAVGGMVVPAGFYLMLNAGTSGARGWGIPMATDIAFALGVLALLGDRVPFGLKVFLTALAIVDDLGAVLVIAVFYTSEIHALSLALGLGFLAALFLLAWLGARSPLVYTLVGTAVWVAFLKSGVHATVAGVLVAMAVPARARIAPSEFLAKIRKILAGFEEAQVEDEEGRQSAVQALEDACDAVQTPLQQMEHALHPWVTYAILPVFALANAGLGLNVDLGAALAHPVTLGMLLGLVLGKTIGITLFSWLAVRTGLAALPANVTWRQLNGAGWLGGIGFTMSLFIAGLAFGESELLSDAKLGILSASVVAGTIGYALLVTGRPVTQKK